MSSPPQRLLVLGLDGASLDVLDPLIAAGRLPNLAAWRREGTCGPLPSTVPPCLWISATKSAVRRTGSSPACGSSPR